MTHPEDKFFTWIGKAMSVFGLLVVAALVAYALAELYRADQGSAEPTFTVAPDSTPRKVKP